MSYNADRDEVGRQLGDYAAQILKGAKPSDLPVVVSSKFIFVINVSTAKALGLSLSPDVPGPDIGLCVAHVCF